MIFVKYVKKELTRARHLISIENIENSAPDDRTFRADI